MEYKYKLLLTIGILLISSLGYSQYNYKIELESLNNKEPKEVLDDISQHIEVCGNHFENGVFFFKSKTLYTESNFNEIASATGYTIKEFEIIPPNKSHREINK